MREQLARYLAMIANIDENMGRLEAFLRETGLRDNTIVVFLTDNGSTFGPRYFNAGMRGGKVTLWEGGHRVPCFVRWPAGGLRPAGDVAGLTEVQDLLPTLLDLAGVKPPAAAKFDGLSLAGVLRGTSEPPADRTLVVQFSRMDHPAAAAGRRLRAVAPLATGAGQGTLRPRRRSGAGAERHRRASRDRRAVARALRRVVGRRRPRTERAAARDHRPRCGAARACSRRANGATCSSTRARRSAAANARTASGTSKSPAPASTSSSCAAGRANARRRSSPDCPRRKSRTAHFPAGASLPIAKARLKIAAFDRTVERGRLPTMRCRSTCRCPPDPPSVKPGSTTATGRELCGAYYVYARRLHDARRR